MEKWWKRLLETPLGMSSLSASSTQPWWLLKIHGVVSSLSQDQRAAQHHVLQNSRPLCGARKAGHSPLEPTDQVRLQLANKFSVLENLHKTDYPVFCCPSLWHQHVETHRQLQTTTLQLWWINSLQAWETFQLLVPPPRPPTWAGVCCTRKRVVTGGLCN